MKRTCVLLILIMLSSACYSQFYDISSILATSQGHHSVSLHRFNNDKYGNRFSIIRDRPCLPCFNQHYISWNGPSGSGTFSFPGSAEPDMVMHGDLTGDVFAFGTFSPFFEQPVIFGTDLNTTLGMKALIKIGSSPWAMLIDANVISVNDSGYCFASTADTTRLYSPAGILLWSHAGGGDYLYGNGNLSYFISDSLGIKKYLANGSLVWQSPFNGNFRVTNNLRIIMKQGSTVYELSTSTGQVLSAHAGGIQGSLFDNKGNSYVYNGNTMTKYDSSGVAWQTHLTGSDFNHVGLDRYDNIYFGNSYVTHDINDDYAPIPLFVPPSININPLPINVTVFETYMAYNGRINQQTLLNPKINTGPVKAICRESKTPVPFTVTQFRVGFENGFRAELSDATGNFSHPIILGTGNVSPIEGNTPFFNVPGNKYKIRVVSNAPEIIGTSAKISQFAYAPQAEISVPASFNDGPFLSSCEPIVFTASPANLQYEWLKQPWGGAYNIFYSVGSDDTLMVSNSAGDSYKLIVTDTSTGCSNENSLANFYSHPGSHQPDFFLPVTLSVNDAPFPLFSRNGGVFSGNHVANNIFYPDSAGAGQHAVNWHRDNPPPCFTYSDTTRNIFVDTTARAIHHVTVSPAKPHYCIGDTVTVSFLFDSSAFNPANKFKVQYGTGYSEGNFNKLFISAGSVTSPIKVVLNSEGEFRIRVVSNSPFVTPAYNHEGNIQVDAYPGATLTINDQKTNCAPENSIITVSGDEDYNTKYYWHFNNKTVKDTFGIGSSILAEKSGNYSVKIVNTAGCITLSDTVHIADTLDFPQFSFVPPSAGICEGDSLLVTLNTDSTDISEWFWFSTPIFPPDPHHVYFHPGYGVTITSAAGCFITKTQAISYTSIPLPNSFITANGPLTFCKGGSVTLSVPNQPGCNYLWKRNGIVISGEQSHVYVASASGTYSVTVTDTIGGCSNTGSELVTRYPLPVAVITPQGPLTFCAGDSVILQADTGAGYTYQWKVNGFYILFATNSSYTATSDGNYRVEVTSAEGCFKVSAAAVVSVPCRASAGPIANDASFRVLLSPNPSGGDFNFEFSKQQDEMISIEILDITGRTVLDLRTTEEFLTIHGSALKAGIYTARISNGKEKSVVKLVKTE